MRPTPWFTPYLRTLKPEPRIARDDWGRFAWFLLGIVAGIGIAAGYLP